MRSCNKVFFAVFIVTVLHLLLLTHLSASCCQVFTNSTPSKFIGQTDEREFAKRHAGENETEQQQTDSSSQDQPQFRMRVFAWRILRVSTFAFLALRSLAIPPVRTRVDPITTDTPMTRVAL